MRFVPTKTPEQQICLMLHGTHHLYIRQQTAVINSIRAYLLSSSLSRRSGAKEFAELLNAWCKTGPLPHLLASAGQPPSASGRNASSPRIVATGFTRSHSPVDSAGVLT